MKNFLDAPKIKRTHCYGQSPIVYDIECPFCKDHRTTWSEFEKHIWCFDCEKDIYIYLNHSGIFSGPIPWGVAHVLGVRFDRINVDTQEIFLDDDPDYFEKLDKSFVISEELNAYETKEDTRENSTGTISGTT